MNQSTREEDTKKEKVYLTTQDVEDTYSMKASFQAKYRIAKDNPIPYIRPAGSKVVLYHKDKLEKWLDTFSINE